MYGKRQWKHLSFGEAKYSGGVMDICRGMRNFLPVVGWHAKHALVRGSRGKP